jgi:parvulin-like peptidyl-prolyl isomerase
MTAFLKVNGNTIDIAAAVRQSLLHNGTFLRDTLRVSVIRQYAEKQNIRNSDAELQLAVDELRYSRNLETVEAAEQWMRDSHQTPFAVQDGIDAMLLNNKVRNSISDDKLQAYYADHKLEYEAAELYSIRVDSESKAKELLAQLNDEGADFHVLAREHSQDEDSRHLGGFVGRLTRSEMTGGVAAAVFAPRPAAVIGPVKTEHGWNLFKVAKIHKPTYEEAKDRLRVAVMEQLVAKLIAEAKIEYPVFEEQAALSRA